MVNIGSASTEPKGELKRGEHKSLQTDRVVLVPGPSEEVQAVQNMYQWLIEENLSLSHIAKRLNASHILTDLDREWTSSTVRQVLTNEKNIGNNVYNRCSFKLKKKHVNNPPEMWIRKEGAYEGLVSLDTFMRAQEVLADRSRRLSDEELLEHLKRLYDSCGHLSGFIINQTEDMPNAATYAQRFGSLSRAYELVGYFTNRNSDFIEINKRLRRLHPEIIQRTTATITELGGKVDHDPKTDLLLLNDELAISLVIARCQTSENGMQRWRIRFDTHAHDPDLTIAVRLDSNNELELDYYLLPRLDLPTHEIRVSTRNSVQFECFRFDNLRFFYGMSEREPLTPKTFEHARKERNDLPTVPKRPTSDNP